MIYEFLKIIIMNEKTSSNIIENDNLNTEKRHYTNLITKLKEISKTIVLLEKTIFK